MMVVLTRCGGGVMLVVNAAGGSIMLVSDLMMVVLL